MVRYAICSDQVLRNIAKARPSDEENLSLVDGVNLVKILFVSRLLFFISFIS